MEVGVALSTPGEFVMLRIEQRVARPGPEP
jgi:hypothetical protein